MWERKSGRSPDPLEHSCPPAFHSWAKVFFPSRSVFGDNVWIFQSSYIWNVDPGIQGVSSGFLIQGVSSGFLRGSLEVLRVCPQGSSECQGVSPEFMSSEFNQVYTTESCTKPYSNEVFTAVLAIGSRSCLQWRRCICCNDRTLSLDGRVGPCPASAPRKQ